MRGTLIVIILAILLIPFVAADNVLVYLDQDANLEEVKLISNSVEEINDNLEENTQKIKSRFLRSLNNPEVIGDIEILNAVIIDYPNLEQLRNNPYVLKVDELTLPFETHLEYSVPTIQPSSFYAAGINGTGVNVSVVDSGVTPHDDLDINLISQDFSISGNTADSQNHGTHVAGIIASAHSTQTGVSPYISNLINAKIIGTIVTEATPILGMDWAITQKAQILSNSWGCGSNVYTCEDYQTYCFSAATGDDVSWTLYMDSAVDAYDLVFVVSAGNKGACGNTSITPPADAYNVITVGATTDKGTSSRADDTYLDLATHGFETSRGPTYDGRKKPDVVAPGAAINSTSKLGGFISQSGTSMAAPHVSGASAILTQYGLTNLETKALLINTAEDYGEEGWDQYYGWGLINLEDAFNYKAEVLNTTINESEYKFYELINVSENDSSTLVWNRHVTYVDLDTQTTYGLNNLDLYLYNESNGEELDYSNSSIDNVEQLVAPSNISTALIKLKAVNTDFTHGSNEEGFALSFYNTTFERTGPVLFLNQSITSALESGFNVSVTINNSGDLPAHNLNITVNLPAGLNTSNQSQIITILDNGTLENIIWEINVLNEGNYSINVSLNSSSYGEYFTNETPSEYSNITDDDTTAPTVINVSGTASSISNGDTFNVSANITDNIGVGTVTVYYTHGSTLMVNSIGDIYNATVSAPGTSYAGQTIYWWVVAGDSDDDRYNDSVQTISSNNSVTVAALPGGGSPGGGGGGGGGGSSRETAEEEEIVNETIKPKLKISSYEKQTPVLENNSTEEEQEVIEKKGLEVAGIIIGSVVLLSLAGVFIYRKFF